MPGANAVCALKSSPVPFNFIVVVAPALTPLIVIVPSAAPLQLTFVELANTVTAIGCVIITLVVAVHPFESATVNVYVPAAKPVCDGVTVNVPVPPDPVITTEPVEPPLQETFTLLVNVAVTAVGSVTVILVVAAHPLASVTV